MTLSPRPRFRTVNLACALAALLVGGRAVQAQSGIGEGNLIPAVLRVGFTKASFIGVNENDMEAAFKVFAQTAGKKRGYLLQTQTYAFDNLADLEAAAATGRVMVVIFDTWDYLALRHPEVLEPKVSPYEQGVLFKKYLLLTQRGKGQDRLPDLRSKSIEVLENVNVNLARQWLEFLLLEQRLGPPQSFFSSVQVVEKTPSAVLPVFFGKKEACVVDEPAFRVMTELNPQVGQRLQALATSEAFLDSLIAFSCVGWQTDKDRVEMFHALVELHLEPAGQQVLNLFKTTRLVPFQPSHLDTVKELWAKLERLRSENR